MKPDFLYSTDFLAMNAPELSHTCMHLLCTAGEGSFVFNEKCYHIGKNDLVVMPNPTRAKNLAAAPGMQVEWFAADNKYLGGLLPSNNYSIGAASRSTTTLSSSSPTGRRTFSSQTSTASVTAWTPATCCSTVS